MYVCMYVHVCMYMNVCMYVYHTLTASASTTVVSLHSCVHYETCFTLPVSWTSSQPPITTIKAVLNASECQLPETINTHVCMYVMMYVALLYAYYYVCEFSCCVHIMYKKNNKFFTSIQGYLIIHGSTIHVHTLFASCVFATKMLQGYFNNY